MAEEKSVEELKADQDALLEKLKVSGWKPEDTPEFKGIIRDNQSERQRAQTMADENQRLREQLDLIIGEKGTPPSEEDSLKGASDDDYMTVKMAKELLQQTVKKGETLEAQRQRDAMQNRLLESEEKAKAKLTVEKTGEGLDWSTVFNEGYKKMIAKNPGYQQAVLNSPDPAMEAYRIGLMELTIAKRVDTSKNAKLLDEMSKSGKTPKISGGVGTGLEDKTYDELLNTPASEIERSLRAEEESRKK